MTVDLRSRAICGSDQRITLYHPARSPGPVVRCAQCGLINIAEIQQDNAIIDNGPVADHLEERLLCSHDLNDLVGSWELAQLPAKRAEAPVLRLNALDALRRILPFRQPPGRLLDFGCGWGFFLDTARAQGWEIHGIEPLPGHAIYARAQFGANVVTDILRADTFAPDSFDVITSFQVFEHLPDPAGDLEKLQVALKPGGVILIEAPNIDTWSVRLMGKHHRHFVHDHLNFFSAATLSALLVRHGIRVVNTYFPTRRMSVRHLVTAWGGRYLPERIAHLLRQNLQKMGLWERTIQLNLGDILAVIGQKPE